MQEHLEENTGRIADDLIESAKFPQFSFGWF
jgi:hypothetical protein